MARMVRITHLKTSNGSLLSLWVIIGANVLPFYPLAPMAPLLPFSTLNQQ
jgi:hypothetical protein